MLDLVVFGFNRLRSDLEAFHRDGFLGRGCLDGVGGSQGDSNERCAGGGQTPERELVDGLFRGVGRFHEAGGAEMEGEGFIVEDAT